MTIGVSEKKGRSDHHWETTVVSFSTQRSTECKEERGRRQHLGTQLRRSPLCHPLRHRENDRRHTQHDDEGWRPLAVAALPRRSRSWQPAKTWLSTQTVVAWERWRRGGAPNLRPLRVWGRGAKGELFGKCMCPSLFSFFKNFLPKKTQKTKWLQ